MSFTDLGVFRLVAGLLFICVQASIHWCPRCPNTRSFWPCGAHLYVDTPRIFDDPHRAKMCKKLQLVGDFVPQTSTGALPLDHTVMQEPETRIHGWMTLTIILVPNCIYCLKCTKFGKVIIRKITKIVGTRCDILR